MIYSLYKGYVVMKNGNPVRVYFDRDLAEAYIKETGGWNVWRIEEVDLYEEDE